MTELDERLAAMLRARAEEDEMNIEVLLAGAQRRGRALRRRRYAIGGSAAAVLLVAGLLSAAGNLTPTLTPTLIPAVTPPTAPSWPAVVTGGPEALPHPPLTSVAVPATELAAQLGNGEFHFDLHGFVGVAPHSVGWLSDEGREMLWVRRTEWVSTGADVLFESTVDLMLTLTREPYDSWLRFFDNEVTSSAQVRGVPAKVVWAGDGRRGPVRASVSWEPAPGVHAQLMIEGDVAEVLRAADLVRFDRVHRCAIPARLGPPPGGQASPLLPVLPSAQTSCSMDFKAPETAGPAWRISSSVTFTFDTWHLVVRAGPLGPRTDPPTTTVNGRPARVETYGGKGHQQTSVEIELPDHAVHLSAAPEPSPEGQTPFDEADIVALAEGCTIVPGQDPAGWPASPVG